MSAATGPARERFRWPRTLPGKQLLVLTLAALGAISYGVPAAVSVLVGGGIQLVNLRGLERSVAWLTGGAPGPIAHVAGGLRFVLVLASALVALAMLPIDPLAFGVGIATVVPAAIWHGLSPGPLERGA